MNAARGRAVVALIALCAVVVLLRADRIHRADAAVLHSGVLGGAEYLIAIPPRWNGGLVVFAHGYEGEGDGPGKILTPPLAARLAERGWAWAASGYRRLGYRPDWFLDDTLALRAQFVARFGTPRRTIVHGQSMGGHVAIAALEIHPGIFDGALIECGAIDGIGLIDWFYAHAALVEYFAGIRMLDGIERRTFDALVNGPWPDLAPLAADRVRSRQYDSVLKHLMGVDPQARDASVRQRVHMRARLPLAREAQEFARHADTRHVRYRIDPGLGLDEEALNRDVPRITHAPGARSRAANPVFAELTGKIRAPVVSLHETGDARVPFRVEQDYRRRTLTAGTAHLLVQRAIPSATHCGFDAKTRERAFDDLVTWIERGEAPAGDDVLAPAGDR